MAIANKIKDLLPFPTDYRWYYLSGVKFYKLPNVSFTRPDFLKYAMIQDVA